MVRLSRLIIIITILCITGFMGFVSTSDFYLGPIAIIDIPIILLLFYFVDKIFGKGLTKSKLMKPVYFYLVLTTIVILSMPFRGAESLIGALRVGRHFYILLLAFVVADNICFEGSYYFIRRVVFIAGTYYSVLSILNYLFPGFVASIWQGIGTLDDIKGGVVRHVLKSNDGLLFMHFAFIIKWMEILYLKRKKNISSLAQLFFYAVAVFMMGYRAVMLCVFLSVLVVTALNYRVLVKHQRVRSKSTVRFISIAVVVLFFANFFSGNTVFRTFSFIAEEIEGNVLYEESTFSGRLSRSEEYQLMILRESPLFGQGFVHKGSDMAEELGYEVDDDYSLSLYYFDFGYGTMAVMFGIVGSLFIIIALIRCIIHALELVKRFLHPLIAQLPAVLIAFLVCNYSFGVLEYTIGLVIIALSIGVAAGVKRLSEKNITSMDNV